MLIDCLVMHVANSGARVGMAMPIGVACSGAHVRRPPRRVAHREGRASARLICLPACVALFWLNAWSRVECGRRLVAQDIAERDWEDGRGSADPSGGSGGPFGGSAGSWGLRRPVGAAPPTPLHRDPLLGGPFTGMPTALGGSSEPLGSSADSPGGSGDRPNLGRR